MGKKMVSTSNNMNWIIYQFEIITDEARIQGTSGGAWGKKCRNNLLGRWLG
jgi:hypothetical protein